VARLYDVSGIDEIFCNWASFYEASLVRVDNVGDERLQAICKTFGAKFYTKVLQRDRPKLLWASGSEPLGKQNDI
jgi:hypothetical protein